MAIKIKKYCVICGKLIFNRMIHAKYCKQCAISETARQRKETAKTNYHKKCKKKQ